MMPRLKVLAELITWYLGYRTVLGRGYCSTDRHIPGTRLRREGKGREGTLLEVFGRKGERIFKHNAADTYRCNQDVANWLVAEMIRRKLSKCKFIPYYELEAHIWKLVKQMRDERLRRLKPNASLIKAAKAYKRAIKSGKLVIR